MALIFDNQCHKQTFVMPRKKLGLHTSMQFRIGYGMNRAMNQFWIKNISTVLRKVW